MHIPPHAVQDMMPTKAAGGIEPTALFANEAHSTKPYGFINLKQPLGLPTRNFDPESLQNAWLSIIIREALRLELPV